jgi:multidrug efflux pump subunit AcrA (membrane-fusion protein)
MALRMTNSRARVPLIALAAALLAYSAWRWNGASKPDLGAIASANAELSDATGAAAHDRDSADLSDSQLASVKVEPVEEREFPVEKEAVGSIDFDEEMAVQVFTPYQGRIIALFASVGDDVKKGQTLFTIDSAGRVHLDRGGWRAGIDHAQLGAASRALYHPRDIATRSRPGDVRSTNR